MQTGWEELVGSKAGDGYLLRALIGSTDRSAVYRTFRGEEPAALKLVSADEEPAARPQFEHPQLVRLYSSGQAELEGTPFRYFVMEPADENLASVIAARALSEDETRSMLVPLLEALSYLHELGLAHGRIRPSNILAIGDSVKLSSDSVRSIGAVASSEEDMRALGLTIIEVLTQERQASAIAQVHSPLREIVEHSLQPDPALRWTARQALAHLSGDLPALGPVAPEPEPQVAPIATVAKSRLEPRTRLIPIWVLPAAAVVMLVAVIYVLVGGTGSSSDSSLNPSVAAASNPAHPVVPPTVVPPPQPLPVPPPKPTPFEPASRPTAKAAGTGWFVVVASYTREADAALEAAALNRRFSQFKPSVFPPSAIDTHYLVIIGSGLSQERAEAVRQRAVASGLPPDTYIKKYPVR